VRERERGKKREKDRKKKRVKERKREKSTLEKQLLLPDLYNIVN
jgi:hypothetical protein